MLGHIHLYKVCKVYDEAEDLNDNVQLLGQ